MTRKLQGIGYMRRSNDARSCLEKLCPLFVLLLIPFSAHAQSNSGQISGSIHDPSGAVIPGASVTLTNTDRDQLVRTVTTDSQGFYSAPQLPLGHYKITVTDSGFKQQDIQGITLHVDDALTFNATLSVGSTSQLVTVNAAALQVDTESATNATLINGKQIVQLPLNNRNYEQLVQLQPGVAYGGGDQLYIGLSNPFGETNVVSFSINGQRNSANNWTVDGADNVDRGSNLTLLIYPSVDAIAEFKTLRNTYSAAFGRSASGQIDVITKSGTHDFHGNAYEFFRNDVLDANYFFSKHSGTPRPPLRYNDFGYTLGGPVFIPHIYNSQRNKTFFFFSQELRRVITYAPLVFTGVPTAAERGGVFPNQVCANTACTAGTNQITTLDPTAQTYLKDVWSKIPLPNSATDPNGLTVTERNVYNADQQIVRIDHNLTSIRPVTTYPSLHHLSPLKSKYIEGVDFIIFRELTGGIYFGEKKTNEEQTWASDDCSYTQEEVERIAHLAFQSAQKRRKKLTLVDKANVLETSRLWRKVVKDIAPQYPDVQLGFLFADNAAMQIVLNPKQFDVILTDNLFGDILSDEASIISGSLARPPKTPAASPAWT